MLKLTTTFKEQVKMILNKKFKYLIIIIVTILILLVPVVIFISEKESELRLIIINTYEEKAIVSCMIFEGSEDNFFVKGRETTLIPNESYMFYFKFDKSCNIFKVLIRVWDSSHSYRNPNAYQYYNFSDGELHDLLVIINSSGDTMLIVKIPESMPPVKLDFSCNKKLL